MYHDAVELPQYNHNPVDEDYLDTKEIKSLRMPYLCGQPLEACRGQGQLEILTVHNRCIGSTAYLNRVAGQGAQQVRSCVP